MSITFLTTMIGLLMISVVNAAMVHTPTLPCGISYTHEELATNAIYLEGESLGKKNQSDTFPKDHQSITLFRFSATPYGHWGAGVGYDQSRLAVRGSEGDSLSNQHLVWKNTQRKLRPGLYDVYVRCMISSGGTNSFAFKQAVDIKSLQYAKTTEPISYSKSGLSWICIGSVDVQGGDNAFELTVSTLHTPVRIDTVLLVRVPPSKVLPLQFRRQPNPNAISDRPGGLIFATETATITYDIQAFKQLKDLDIALSGAEGQIIKTIHNPIFTPINKERAKLEIELPGRGYFVIALRASTKSGRMISMTTTATVLGRPIGDALRMKSCFGLSTVHGDKQLMQAANGRWNYNLLSMFRVQESDVNRAETTDVQVLSPIDSFAPDFSNSVKALSFGLPNWLTGIKPNKDHRGFGSSFSPPKDWNKLDKLLDYYFRENKHRLSRYLEVYGEPLAHWKGTYEELVRFHHAVAKSVKKVNPDIKVLGPCLYSIRMGQLEQLASLGLFDNLNGISMHAYVNNSTPETQFLDRLMALAAFRKRPPYADLPVFLTEFGWTSVQGTWQVAVDELTQARFCARSLALCFSENIDAMIYFCMEFHSKNAGEAGFSLIDPTGRPKAGYASFATIARAFASATPVTRLKLLPDVYLVVGKRSDHYVASLWSTGQNHTLRLPFPISSAVDMVGQPITMNPSGQLLVSPSPIYIQMPDFPIDVSAFKPQDVVVQGQDLPGNTGKLFAFDSNWYRQGRLEVPANAMPGSYLLLTQSGNRWQPQTITVQRPFKITSARVDWPLEDDFPALRVILTSLIDTNTLHVQLNLKTDQSENRTSVCSLPPHTARETRFDLRDIPFGERLQGTISAKSAWQGKPIAFTAPLDITVIPAYRKDKIQKWNEIPGMDFTKWKPYRTLDNEDPSHPDCVGQLKCRYDSAALELSVHIQDDEHYQNLVKQSPGRIWAQDSIQLAFDMDFDKPWAAGVGGQELLGGHRVFEFSIGKNTNRPTGVAFRQISYLKKLPANVVEPAIKVSVHRTKDITDYHIVIPWQVLGLEKSVVPGERIGFALLVNDVDPKAKRKKHGLRLFEGIAESKDPKLFGPMWLR